MATCGQGLGTHRSAHSARSAASLLSSVARTSSAERTVWQSVKLANAFPKSVRPRAFTSSLAGTGRIPALSIMRQLEDHGTSPLRSMQWVRASRRCETRVSSSSAHKRLVAKSPAGHGQQRCSHHNAADARSSCQHYRWHDLCPLHYGKAGLMWHSDSNIAVHCEYLPYGMHARQQSDA